jgi:hypothetical protein
MIGDDEMAPCVSVLGNMSDFLEGCSCNFTQPSFVYCTRSAP